MALLLDHWAEPAQLDKRPAVWQAKLEDLRAAVLAGLAQDQTGPAEDRRGPRSEEMPHELIADEYKVILEAMQWLRNNRPSVQRDQMVEWLGKVAIPVGVSPDRVLNRAFPGREEDLLDVANDLNNPRSAPSATAARLVAERLGCVRERTVRNATGKTDRPAHARSPTQRLLASLFLDLCSHAHTADRFQLQTRMLDALLASGYSYVVLYYLVQLGHKVPANISLRLAAESDIRHLCELVYAPSGGAKEGRFNRLARG